MRLITRWMLVLACAACLPTENAAPVACGRDADCDTGRCRTSGVVGEGICTSACDSDADCAAGWRCLSHDSGTCAPTCASDADCDELGSRWRCEEESLEGSSAGKVLACKPD